MVSAWGAAAHRRHDPGRGDPEDPPASEAPNRSTPDCSGAGPPARLCLVLCLTVSGGAPTRPRSPRLGNARRPRLRLPLQSPLIPPRVGSVLHARPRVHQSQPPPLRSAYSVARAFASVSSSSSHRVGSRPPPRSSPRGAGCPSPGPRPVWAGRAGRPLARRCGGGGLPGARGGTGGLLGGIGGCAVKSGPVKNGFIFPILGAVDSLWAGLQL